MKFLLDENQSPRIAEVLAEAGHDVVHVRDIGLGTSPDEQVLDAAREADRVVISADTDLASCSLPRTPPDRRSCSCADRSSAGRTRSPRSSW